MLEVLDGSAVMEELWWKCYDRSVYEGRNYGGRMITREVLRRKYHEESIVMDVL